MKGTTLDAVIDMVRTVSPQLHAPLVLFTYYNPILRKGADKFCEQIAAAGASGASSVSSNSMALEGAGAEGGVAGIKRPAVAAFGMDWGHGIFFCGLAFPAGLETTGPSCFCNHLVLVATATFHPAM